MDGKNGEQPKTNQEKPEWTHTVDDPHDSWGAEDFKNYTEKAHSHEQLSENEIPSEIPGSNQSVELNKAVEDVKEGDVSSIASRKVVYGAARNAMISKQLQDFEASKNKSNQETEETHSEEVSLATKKEADPARERAKVEWKEARDKAREAEINYIKAYEEFIKNESKSWKTLPRRIFGLQPKLPKELEELKEASLNARVEHRLKSQSLYEGISQERKDKLSQRHQSMLAHYLLVSVQKERIKSQQRAMAEGWQQNEGLRKALDTIGRHKYSLAGVAIGTSVITTGGASIIPILSAVGAGVITRVGTKEVLDATYVKSAKNKLKEAKEKSGEDFFAKELEVSEKEIEKWMYETGARENRSNTAATTLGIAAGAAAGVGVNSYINSYPDPIVVTPDTPPVIDPAPVEIDTPTSEDIEIRPSTGTETEGIDRNEQFGGEVSEESVEESVTTTEKVATDESVADSRSTESIAEKVNNETSKEITSENSSESPALNLTESENTAAFGPVVGPSIENLTTPESVIHEVERGDNVWNIMEGKGPDSNPVGGKSEVLGAMNFAERQYWLDTLFESVKGDEEFARSVGAVKSGNLEVVYPGEQINVTMLDEKLRELIANSGEVVSQGEEAPVPPPRPETLETPDINSDAGSSAVTLETEPKEVLTENQVDTPPAPVESANETIIANAENNNEAVNKLVEGVEKSKGLIFREPAVTGTFEQLKNISFADIKVAAANDSLEGAAQKFGVTSEGYGRWMSELENMAKNTPPASDDETIGQYINRVANTRVA